MSTLDMLLNISVMPYIILVGIFLIGEEAVHWTSILAKLFLWYGSYKWTSIVFLVCLRSWN